MPFFSIIIPSYNRGYIINRPIESILVQTFIDWELIIIDDGSNDNTKDVVNFYNDPRIKYVYQENKERSAARNHGVSLAKGEWICFQDSDDEYLPNHLISLYNEILTSSDFFIIRTGLISYVNGIAMYSNINSHGKYDQHPYRCIQTSTFHNSIFIKHKFHEDIYIGEDLHFLLKIGQEYEIKVIESWTGIYHHDPNNSGGIGPNYKYQLDNSKMCIEDIMKWNKTLIIPFLRWKRCFISILMLKGHIKYNPSLIKHGIYENLYTFLRFPMDYTLLVIRICFVKFGEFSGLYRTQGRF